MLYPGPKLKMLNYSGPSDQGPQLVPTEINGFQVGQGVQSGDGAAQLVSTKI